MSILHGFWSLYKQTREVFSHKRSFLSLERIREVDVYSSQIAHETSLSSQASRHTSCDIAGEFKNRAH